ncbi:MAG: hypothetical protein B6I20_11380 [Bacteroidetes bacterium 4572_117]|nr:MAG: hypothetical protein B6I20_11380 [Bacteroidetes bacterium 4572_117]
MSKLKILVVDDEPGIRSGITRILRNFVVSFAFMEEDFEFDILESETGEDAVKKLDSQSIDITLLDNKLPGIEGIEVLEYIKKNKIGTAVMMITSYASLDLAVKATKNGAFNFIPKPFTPQELRAAIESITKHLFLKRMTKKMHAEGKQIRFQFLSVLSHELKSPLNAIEGYLRIMQDKQVGVNIDDYEVMISRSMERIKGMRDLIIDLLDLTRIESGEKKQNLKDVNLVEIANLSIDTMEPMAIQKNVKIITDFPEQEIITADVNEIEIIFNNLLSNAIKYNKDDGEVYISLKKGNGEFKIIVRDTGIGMSEEDTLQLFKEFSRIRNEKTKSITGSGLGLSITQKILKLYNGKIEVKSEEDKGTEFTVTIPEK